MAAPRLGEADAEQLVERHAERVYRLALRITGVTDDAEEIVEDAPRSAVRAQAAVQILRAREVLWYRPCESVGRCAASHLRSSRRRAQCQAA